jgi:hypothetical protein
MTPSVRWLLVLVVAVLVLAPTTVVRLFPAKGSTISAADLAERINAAQDRGWSGEVATQGALQVPVSDSFSGVARLFGDSTTLRVWWGDDRHWRVDRTRASGETDLFRDGDDTVKWSYESEKATLTPYSDVRLPNEADVLPSTLAARLLSGARDAELSRLPSARIAGHDSAGLRLIPSDSRSTIARADIWADQASGLPTRVEVYAAARNRPVLTTEVTSLDVGKPDASTVRFRIPGGVRIDHSRALDEAAGANAFAPFQPPETVAGLPRRGSAEDLGAVGIYGRGPTALIAFPLRTHVASELRDQLLKSKPSHETSAGVGIEVGPLTVLLARGDRASYLLAGTVTPATLVRAAAELRTGVRLTR